MIRHEIPAGLLPVPITCAWDEDIADGDRIVGDLTAVIPSIDAADAAWIATFLRDRRITSVQVEVSRLWGDHDKVAGRVECCGQFLHIKFPPCHVGKPERRRRFVVAHELAHVAQHGQGILPSDEVDADEPLSHLTTDGKNRIFRCGGRVWGTSVDLEWDADRRARTWGFPRPSGNRIHEAVIRCEGLRITVFRNEQALAATAADLVETLNRQATFPDIEFYVEADDAVLVEHGPS